MVIPPGNIAIPPLTLHDPELGFGDTQHVSSKQSHTNKQQTNNDVNKYKTQSNSPKVYSMGLYGKRRSKTKCHCYGCLTMERFRTTFTRMANSKRQTNFCLLPSSSLCNNVKIFAFVVNRNFYISLLDQCKD